MDQHVSHATVLPPRRASLKRCLSDAENPEQVRLGCFEGNWLESALAPRIEGLALLSLFGGQMEQSESLTGLLFQH